MEASRAHSRTEERSPRAGRRALARAGARSLDPGRERSRRGVVGHRLSEAPSGRFRPEDSPCRPREGRQSSAEDQKGKRPYRITTALASSSSAKTVSPTSAHSGRGLQLDDRQVPPVLDMVDHQRKFHAAHILDGCGGSGAWGSARPTCTRLESRDLVGWRRTSIHLQRSPTIQPCVRAVLVVPADVERQLSAHRSQTKRPENPWTSTPGVRGAVRITETRESRTRWRG